MIRLLTQRPFCYYPFNHCYGERGMRYWVQNILQVYNWLSSHMLSAFAPTFSRHKIDSLYKASLMTPEQVLIFFKISVTVSIRPEGTNSNKWQRYASKGVVTMHSIGPFGLQYLHMCPVLVCPSLEDTYVEARTHIVLYMFALPRVRMWPCRDCHERDRQQSLM